MYQIATNAELTQIFHLYWRRFYEETPPAKTPRQQVHSECFNFA